MVVDSGSVDVRIANANDTELVLRITKESFLEYSYTGVPSGALNETVSQIRESIENNEEHALLCYVNGTAVGTARFYREDGIYFRRLGVLPEFRGQGISKIIVSSIERYAKENGETRVWCRTRSDVERNMRLYLKLGFEIEEEKFIEKNGHKIKVATFSKRVA